MIDAEGFRPNVGIVLMNPKGQVLWARRIGGQDAWQFPQGGIKSDETPEQALYRELKEEVGFGAKHFVELKKVSMAPSYFNATMHILYAEDLYPETLPGDEPEPLVVVKWPISDWQSLLQQEDFTEARSVAALLLLTKYLESGAGNE